MLIKSKIDLKKFFLISITTTIVFCLFSRDMADVLTIIAVYAATLLHLFMLSEAVYELTLGKDGGNRKKIVFLFIGKFAVLALALTLGVQIMGSRIIIPVLNYVFQIFVLTLSFYKKV